MVNITSIQVRQVISDEAHWLSWILSYNSNSLGDGLSSDYFYGWGTSTLVWAANTKTLLCLLQ